MDLWGESSVYGLGCESVGKETVGRPRRRCVDNIRMVLLVEVIV